MTGSREPLFEMVPNISEGRDPLIVDACVAALSAGGVRVIGRTSDPVHHRSVLTAIGNAAQTVASSVALAAAVAARIDLRRHTGAHPRIGALDVLPFVPLRNATLGDAIGLARSAAERIGRELQIPSYLYGAAASAEHRQLLADVRRGEFAGLRNKCRDPRWQFDYGDRPHPTAGAIAIGARLILIAYNIELATGDITIAQQIAAALRERNGGLRTLRALGIRLSARCVQVSFNITDYHATPLYLVMELVRRLAADAGVEVGRSELIGLAPRAAIAWTARAYAAERHEP